MFLFVVAHASAASAKGVGLGVSFTEGGGTSALNKPIFTITLN